LYYLQSRYYNPEWQRFVNADDASMIDNSSELLTNNLFAYVENNPVNKSDPDGHFSGVIAHVGERALIILFTAIAQLGRTAAIQVLVSLLPSVAAVAVVVVVAVAIYAYYRTHKSQVDNWLAQSKKGADKTASKKGNTFRGGSKSSRDKWYGKNDKDFQKWWEKQGKKGYGHDIEDKEMADEVWQEWVDLGKPKVK
jgi:hypothetical protein